MVVDEEWPQILEAFKKFSNVEGRKQYRPKVSIFICGYGGFLSVSSGKCVSDEDSLANATMPNSGLRTLNSRIGMGTHVLGR